MESPADDSGLLMLGIEVAQSTVTRYMTKRHEPPSQGWKTSFTITPLGSPLSICSWFALSPQAALRPGNSPPRANDHNRPQPEHLRRPSEDIIARAARDDRREQGSNGSHAQDLVQAAPCQDRKNIA